MKSKVRIANNPKPYWINITPELAAEWLARPGHNRTVKDHHVLLLADQMRQGEWKPNGESLKRTADGKLLDGQHRLMACTVSKVSFLTLAVDGIDETAYLTIDQALRRVTDDRIAVARSREQERQQTLKDSDPFTQHQAEVKAEKDRKRGAAMRERAKASVPVAV